ncbi:MAG: hypothetical protein NTY38_22220 [Acidobacteria bacterium]|nr:hypothetical protein [Acidobacteriota bacterium]
MRAICLLLLAGLATAQGQPCVPAPVDAGRARELLAGGGTVRWPDGKVLVEARGPGFALAWIDRAKAIVLLRRGGGSGTPSLITFERIAPADKAACPAATLVAIPDWLGSRVFLHAFQVDGASPIIGQSVVGAQAGSHVVLFPREGDHPRTISFDTEGRGPLHYLLTGLSPGTWEVWWNGGLVDPDLPAGPGGTLSFDGAPGGYFLRRR